MDDLFLLPQAAVAMPRAYWLGFDERVLSSQIMLVEPSPHEFSRVVKTMEAGSSGDYDMEIVNTLYKDKALILPHRPYNLLTGEFAAKPEADHQNYLGDEEEQWDPDAVLQEAKYLHFSDWPMPKVCSIFATKTHCTNSICSRGSKPPSQRCQRRSLLAHRPQGPIKR